MTFYYFIALLISVCCFDEALDLQADCFQNAKWINDGNKHLEHDFLLFRDNPSPVLRKEFSADEKIESAILYITAAGYYKAALNGNDIGDVLLDPAWTDYSKRIYYSEYDLTSEINQGANCISVTLGNGFYNPLPLKMWGHLDLREKLPIGNPAFIAKLKLKFKNGKTTEIITDNTWSYSYGPVRKNNVYLGEVYDARKEIAGWGKPGFDDDAWGEAVVCDGPGGELQKSFFPPVRATKTITPVEITSPKKGIYIVDMGVNFTGDYNVRVQGNWGDTITFRFGERIYESGEMNPMTTVCGQIKRKGTGGPGAPDTAWQTDSYIIGDKEEAWYNPSFTFHTYRYMEISGLKNKPIIEDIQGIAFNTDVDNRNHFSCSSGLLNSIQEATVRTFLSNLISVQSDCPAREKFGYGGDLNATSESFIYNLDMQAFYRKTIYDWIDAINDSIFVDTAPYVGINYCGISWESAFLTTQYYLYLYYGDAAIIKELYDFNNKWMEKAASIHPGGIVDEGLSDHESLQPVPVQLTGTCHYLQCARIMESFARVMGDKKRENGYRKLAGELQDKIKTIFWDNPVPARMNKQTLFSALIYHDILPEEETEAARDSLLASLKRGISGHFTTGIFGTKYILEALSKTGCINDVYNVVNSKAFPGWGYMIDNGATTIWETWKESDNTYSNCHPMFGTVTEWFYRWLGGIKPDPDYPGFERFVLSPQVPDSLPSVKCNYHSPMGEIISHWQKEGAGKIVFDIEIPEGTSATFRLPDLSITNVAISEKEGGKKHILDVEDMPAKQIELGAGKYQLSAFTE